jgi:DNA mismatch repair protein MutS2
MLFSSRVEMSVITNRALEVLEFQPIREAIAERASTTMGRELALALMPTSDAYTIRTMIEQLEDALIGASLHLGGITDVRGVMSKLGQGQLVSAPELLDVAYTLDAAMTLRRSIGQHSVGPLMHVAERIGQHTILTRSILEKLNRDGSVRDDASPKLRQLRRRIEPLRSQIRESLTRIMERSSEYLQDKIITIRRDRYVIPVRSSFENQVPGIVVDSSASQQTVFIEPASVVPLNNELARTVIEEEQEVARILLELTRMVAEEPGLWETLRAIAELDLIAAKAALTKEWDLTRPNTSPEGDFEVIDIRHPLIKDCVPNSYRLDQRRRLLLITGPNMGGKTVTLKSLGLAIAMHQSGLFVKAYSAKLPIVEEILCDIGDGQNLLESLSTFAAHLKNLANILERAKPGSLVLIDELGSGTDPSEGAALSQAMIEQLLTQGARGIITSHLTPLKIFASERQDVVNASMSFDVQNLRPTYKLSIGAPGRSYALAIARRLGFPNNVVLRGETILGPEGLQVEKLLEALETERKNLETDASAARVAKEHAEKQEKELRLKLQDLEQQKNQYLLEAQQKADSIYRDAMEQVRQLKAKTRDDLTERPKVMQELRDLRAAAQAERPQMTAVQREPEALKPGANVEVPSYGTNGKILELRGDDVLVQMGLLKVTLKRRDVRLKQQNGIKAPIGGVYISPSSFTKELNLRGAHVEEAIEEVRNFISEAQALHKGQIRILHGKGEGILRRVVRDYLKTDKRISSYSDANPNEGGHGVTVANIRV